jgi:single-strand DNA-binding protein
MARGINKVILIGNLGKDPEVMAAQDNSMVARISVATSEEWTDKRTGQKQQHTEWHSCVGFKRVAEIMQTYLKKGAKVYIDGRLHTNKWTDGQGEQRSRVEIIINQLQMLDTTGNATQETPPNETRYPSEPPQEHDPFDDDIPF